MKKGKVGHGPNEKFNQSGAWTVKDMPVGDPTLPGKSKSHCLRITKPMAGGVLSLQEISATSLCLLPKG
jgi:hypothetical protein